MKSLVSNKVFNLSQLEFNSAIPEKIQNLDFSNLRYKLTHGEEATMSLDVCEFAEQEYKKFLALKFMYPQEALVPNKLVDQFWHTHILDTMSYQMDCVNIFGEFMHHYPYFGIFGDEDSSKLKEAFSRTKEIYNMWFGQYPEYLAATCCKDHACHVPSSCACRVPSACK